MKFLLGFLLAIACMFASETDTIVVFEKLIIASSKSEKTLQDLKVLCLENLTIRTLQKKHHFRLVLEKFGEEHIVVIKPIKSRDVRNTLLILLSSKFENIFYVKYEEKRQTKVNVLQNNKEVKKLLWITMIDLQWVALFLLSLIGLILSIHSRKKIAKLGESQVNLKKEQTKIETDIDILGNDDD
jgi:hypothetical protein